MAPVSGDPGDPGRGQTSGDGGAGVVPVAPRAPGAAVDSSPDPGDAPVAGDGQDPGDGHDPGFVGSTDPQLREALYHTPAWHEPTYVAPPVRVSSVAARVLWGVAWVVVGFLGVVALQRVFWYDRTSLSVALSAYTLYLFLPAWVVTLVAAVRTRWWLAGASFLLVVLHLVWVLPTVPAASRAPALAPTTAQQLEIYSASLDPDHDDPGALLDEIDASDAHVVVLREYTARWADAVRGDDRLSERFGHRVEVVREGREGLAVLSERSLADSEVLEAAGRPIIRVEFSLTSGRARTARSQDVRLFAVNVVSPGEDHDLHERQFDRIRSLVDAEAGTDREIVVVGGFRSTQFNRQLQRLEGAGLAGVHELRGRGLARTYPNGSGLSMPRVRYDHVFVSRGIIVLEASESSGGGAEHRPVRTRIALGATDAERAGASAGADHRAVPANPVP